MAERLNVAREIGEYKARAGIAVTDPERERQLLADRKKYLTGLGINYPGLVEELYKVIFGASKKVQAPTEDVLKPV